MEHEIEFQWNKQALVIAAINAIGACQIKGVRMCSPAESTRMLFYVRVHNAHCDISQATVIASDASYTVYGGTIVCPLEIKKSPNFGYSIILDAPLLPGQSLSIYVAYVQDSSLSGQCKFWIDVT